MLSNAEEASFTTLISPFERMLGQKLAMYTLTDEDLRCRPGVKDSSKAFLDITRSDSQVLMKKSSMTILRFQFEELI
jgi:hypothetical protein